MTGNPLLRIAYNKDIAVEHQPINPTKGPLGQSNCLLVWTNYIDLYWQVVEIGGPPRWYHNEVDLFAFCRIVLPGCIRKVCTVSRCA